MKHEGYILKQEDSNLSIDSHIYIDEGSRIINAIGAELAQSVHMDPEHRTILSLAASMGRDGHVLMDSHPGLGKTTIAKALADIRGGTYTRFQGSPDLTTSDITGNVIYKNGDFQFIPGPIFGDIVLGDEVNRSNAREQAALIEPLAESQVTVNGVTYELPAHHMLLATQNAQNIETGTQLLTNGLRDRFAVSMKFAPYDTDDMVTAAEYGIKGVKANQRLSPGDLALVQRAVGLVALSKSVKYRTANIIISLRDSELSRELDPELTVLAGARPAIIIYRLAKLNAIKNGQQEVYDTDVDRVAKYVLQHRTGLKFGSKATFDELYEDALKMNPQKTIQ